MGIETDGGYGWYGTYDINFTANGNTIDNWDNGLVVYQCPSSCAASNFTSVLATRNTVTNNNIGILVDGGQITGPIHVNNNHIQGNALYGIRNTATQTTVDGSNNWWGATGGPTLGGTQPASTGDTVGTNITYSPYLTGVDYAHWQPSGAITVIARHHRHSRPADQCDHAGGRGAAELPHLPRGPAPERRSEHRQPQHHAGAGYHHLPAGAAERGRQHRRHRSPLRRA